MKRALLLLPLIPFLLLSREAAAQPAQPSQPSQPSGITFGAGAQAQGPAAPPASPAAAPPATPEVAGAEEDPEKDFAYRDAKLNDPSALTGGVGLLHMQHAQGGATGQFRIGFTTEYFSAGFLCSSEFPCADPRNPGGQIRGDSTDHIGGRLMLSMQVAKWLEPYLATSAFANSNPANRPQLLQVLGDTTMGAKAHASLSKIFHLGGAFELWLINGTGSVGLDGAGTSAKFRGLATADLRGAEKRIPVRMSANATYVLDNTGEVVNDVERARGTPITRIERFGLNINRVDHFDISLGTEFFLADEKVRPFVEYGIAIPVNRQDYRCRPNNPSNDKCLATDAFAPSSLTLGSRFFPWKRGFDLTVALDIGISGTGFFIEEVRPTPPWVLYVGAGWAFDTVERPSTLVRERVVVRNTTGRKIRGFVHEEGKSDGIPNAIVAWDNHPELTSLVTGADGRFTTQGLPDGPYAFAIHADGYKPGQCSTVIGNGAPPRPAPGPAPTPAPAPTPGGDIQLDCTVIALPRIGSIVGKVKDAETQSAVGGAAVKVVDSARKDFSGSTDALGSFRFEQLAPGDAQVTVDADGYLAYSDKVDIKVRQDNPADIMLRKKPKNPLVAVQTKEIVIRQQIQFALDSAVILPESNGLLNEIADVLIKNPRIRRVEVQGHTDSTGSPLHNQKLSEERADAVVGWLTSHGVSRDRLTPRGYGDTKPLAPNVVTATRARNRRVQFIILEQDPANPGGGGAAPPKNPLTLP